MEKEMLRLAECKAIRQALTPIPLAACRVDVNRVIEDNNRYSIDNSTDNILIYLMTTCEINGLECTLEYAKKRGVL